MHLKLVQKKVQHDISDPDRAKAGRVMQAMKMIKLDIGAVEAAANEK